MPSTHDVLLRATNRWRELWNTVYSENIPQKSGLVGFTKYSLELCWLAQKILEVSRYGGAKSLYMTSVPTDSLNQLHNFLREYSEKETP